MFNAAYTINSGPEIVVKSLQEMLMEKDYRVESVREDKLETIHIKAVNKSILTTLKYQLKSTRKGDPEAQRAAIHLSVVPTEEGHASLFLSIFPVMEFYHLPEIPGITQSEEERETDIKLCNSILTELMQGIMEMYPMAEENFQTRPMNKVYHLPDSRRSLSRDDVQSTIVDILKHLKFEVIKTNKSEYNLTLEIIAVNKSFFHTALERIKNRFLSKFLKSTQRITARFTIFKPELGTDHKLEIQVEMYPSMEILGKEEIQSLTQSMDEEIADSLLGKDLWEPLISMMDEEFGDNSVQAQ